MRPTERDLSMNQRRRTMTSTFTRSLAGLLAAACAGLAIAADTDIATAPLFTSSNSQVKPNIMFILDDSGSMAWDYLPDAANLNSDRYGRRSSQCNGVAYNPNITYLPPVNADGTSQANASLSVITNLSDPTTQTTSIRVVGGTVTMPATLTGTMSLTVNGWNMNGSTYQIEETVTIFQNNDTGRFFTGKVVSWTLTNGTLGTIVIDLEGGNMEGTGSFSAPRIGKGQPNSPRYYRYTGGRPALSYTYNSSGVITGSTFYQECNSVVGNNPGAAVFTPVSVTAASTEAQNYANWATYYNTRMKLMKAGVSRAFSSIDARYRVGYTTINERTAVEGPNFLDIADFDTTHKASFYSKMFDANPGGSTPLRGALSKAGQYFAKKGRDQTVDPVQYSCQRNFAILSTDGYWNTGSESTSSPKYGPYRLDNNTSVGQQDGSGTLRPMVDGETATSTTLETWTTTNVITRQDVTPQSSTTKTTTYTLTLTPSGSGSPAYRTRNALVRPMTGDNDEISRSGNTITVTITNHNLITGDLITVTGGDNSSLRVTNVPITRTGPDTFTYQVPAGSGSVGSGDYTIRPQAAATCPAGQGVVRSWIQVRRGSYTTATSTTTTVTTQTSTVVVTVTENTPHTRTIVQTDGVVTSDSETAGAVQSSSSSGSPSVVTGSSTSSSATATQGPTLNNTNTFVDAQLPSNTGTTCVSNAPGTSSETAIGGGGVILSGTVNTNTSVANTGTTVSTVTSTVPSESAHVTSAPSTNVTGGVSNSLADVAMYYYQTDLRTSGLSNCTGALGADVCVNNVPGVTANAQRSFGDSAAWQHMTTFTLGLGVGGILNFDPNYLTQTSGDFIDILNRTKNWPQPGGSKGAENTDDLWHAAVNGRGQYFSAGDPNSLATALTSALDSIKAITGAAAAASTSSLQPVEGDNDVFVAQFTSVKWIGDVLSFRIDPVQGTISTTAAWSAKTQLDAKDPATRTIYYPKSGALRAFNHANLTADGYGGYFNDFCTKAGAGGGSPQQCASLSTADRNAANLGSNLVNYLRGVQNLSYYRARESALGDIISASPLFVGKPAFKYTENNYQQYVTDKNGRTAVVLSAANDGMLHAFSRDTGDELWAFMPSFVLPNLYKLADTNYANYHSYFVDGSPQMGDIYVPSGPKQGWRTIVVGGLNAGGRGYYALDVTNPAAPEFLWEFTHANLGLTFGNPIITKHNGRWVVAFTSGYNNNVSGGDGNGRLFLVDAFGGGLITSVATTLPDNTAAGDTTNPSGLGKLNSWVDNIENNTTLRFYAGDLKGNVWRFTFDNQATPAGTAVQLAKLTAPDGTAQSISTRLNLAEINYNGTTYPTVFAATGRYLGTTDAASTTVQSLYAMKDNLLSTGWGTVRTGSDLVPQTLTASTNANGVQNRVLDSQPVDWNTKGGWRLDFPGSGERVTVNPQLTINTLTVGTILPSNSVCTVGGESFLYRFNISSVGVDNSVVGTYVGNVLIQGLTTVQLADGTNVTIITRSDATLQPDPQPPSLDPANLRRTSWRELAD